MNSRHALRGALVLTLVIASAAASGGPIRLREGMGGVADIGATKCDYYAYIHPNAPTGFNQAVLYWFEGYVHARSGKAIDAWLAGIPGGDQWTFDRIGGHVLDYCTGNPGATVADAGGDLWKRIGGQAPGATRDVAP
jgi:hypothetical protein